MKQVILKQLRERWGNNPIVMRSEITKFSCGLIKSAQYIKNLEIKNPKLIKGKFIFGKRKVGYPTEAVLEFLSQHLNWEKEIESQK